jgi:hypothetical protein
MCQWDAFLSTQGIFVTVSTPSTRQFPNRFHLSDSHNYTINNSLSVIQYIEKSLILHKFKAYLVSRIIYKVNYCTYKHLFPYPHVRIYTYMLFSIYPV